MRVDLTLLFILTTVADQDYIFWGWTTIILSQEKGISHSLKFTRGMIYNKLLIGLEDNKKIISIRKIYMSNTHIYIRNNPLRL